jgi:hypothetical protein
MKVIALSFDSALAIGGCGRRDIRIVPEDSGRTPGTNDDPLHCGPSGTSCHGGRCNQGVCEPVQLVAHGGGDLPIAIAGSAILYFDDSGGEPVGTYPLMKVAIAGGKPTKLAHVNFPRGVAGDDSYAYWLDEKPSAVYRVPLDGGTPTVLAKSPDYDPFWHEQDGIVVRSGQIYWIGRAGIMTLPVSGGRPRRLADVHPWNIAVDDRYVYAADSVAWYTVTAIPLDGSPARTLADHEAGQKFVAVDGPNVYWNILETNSSGVDPPFTLHHISSASPGLLTSLVTSQPHWFGFAAADGDLFWCDGLLRRRAANGTTSVLSTCKDVHTLAVDAGHVFLVGNGIAKVVRPL